MSTDAQRLTTNANMKSVAHVCETQLLLSRQNETWRLRLWFEIFTVRSVCAGALTAPRLFL